MRRSKKLCGILNGNSPLAGGLVEQGQVRNLLTGGGWKRRGLSCRGRRLTLERSSGRPRERTTDIRNRTCASSVSIRRGLHGTGAGLRKCWSIGLQPELLKQPGLATCCDVRRRTDLLGKRGGNDERRLLILHSLLARLKQLVDPVLNDAEVALNGQRPKVGPKELAPFLLRLLVQHLNEIRRWRWLTSAVFTFWTMVLPGAHRTLPFKSYATVHRSTLTAEI